MELETKALTVQIPLDLHTDIKTLASSRGLKLKELVIEMFQEKLLEEGVK